MASLRSSTPAHEPLRCWSRKPRIRCAFCTRPVETSQEPKFKFFAAAPADKRHVIFETGHAVVTLQPMIKEVLDWLDKYLGPVQTHVQ